MLALERTRAPRTRREPVLFLPGKLLVFETLLLVVGSALASLHGVLLFVSIIFDASAFVLGIVGIATLVYLVFNTQGRGHYQLTLWKVADAFFANILAQSALNLIAWKLAFATIATPVSMFTNTTPLVGPWYALYDLVLYAALLLTGGGVTDNLAQHETTRTIAALQSAWSSFSYIIIFAAADATLAAHTDEEK